MSVRSATLFVAVLAITNVSWDGVCACEPDAGQPMVDYAQLEFSIRRTVRGTFELAVDDMNAVAESKPLPRDPLKVRPNLGQQRERADGNTERGVALEY